MRRLLAVAAIAAATTALTAGIANAAAAGTHPQAAGQASGQAAGQASGQAAARRATLRHAAMRHAAMRAAGPVDPVRNVSQYAAGEYVSVVTCRGNGAPPPLRLNAPGTPLTLSGTGPSAGVLRALAKPKAYTNVYTCTIVIKQRVPRAPGEAALHKCELSAAGGRAGGGTPSPGCHGTVTLNTGFGGEARAVAKHHPAR